MEIFLSTHSSKIDDKNRVSIPSAFRAVVEAKKSSQIFAYCSFINECIEVCTIDRVLQLNQYIEDLDLFSPERDAMATAILSGGEQLQLDSKGRVCLPDRLLKFAKLDKEAIFVGKGKTFEIWNADQFAEYHQKARDLAINNKIVLKPRGQNER